MNLVDQFRVNAVPLLPECPGARIPHLDDRIHRIGDREDSAPEGGQPGPQPSDDPMVERVNPGQSRAGNSQDLEQGLVMIRPKRLELHPDFEPGAALQRFRQGGDALPIWQPPGPDLTQRQAGYRSRTRDIGVVMYYEGPIGTEMDVELHPVGAQALGLPKSLERVLRGVPGGPAVSEDSGGRTGQGLNKSPNLWSHN